jgi:hypothetical protein
MVDTNTPNPAGGRERVIDIRKAWNTTSQIARPDSQGQHILDTVSQRCRTLRMV